MQNVLVVGAGAGLGIIATMGLYLLVGSLRRYTPGLLAAVGWLTVVYTFGMQVMLLYQYATVSPNDRTVMGPGLWLMLWGVVTFLVVLVAALAWLQHRRTGVPFLLAFPHLMAHAWCAICLCGLLYSSRSFRDAFSLSWITYRTAHSGFCEAMILAVPLLEAFRALRGSFTPVR